jgi:uncharacterized membrane protein YhaH (DUF805 family)
MEYYIGVLKKYSVFKGRARRKEYWMFCFIGFLISIVLSILDSVLGLKMGSRNIGLLGLIYSLVLIVPGIAVYIRRLHDTSHSAWFMLWWLLPIIGWIVLIVVLCKDSTPSDNKYGPNPKAMSEKF